MIDEDVLIKNIIEALKMELPVRYSDQLDEFEKLVNDDLMRASYDVLDKLRRYKDWHPSERLESLIRDYQIVF
jgi:hypothetical protein